MPEQESVCALAEELHETSTISEELWAELSRRFNEQQIIELLVTAGWYHVIAYVCNGAPRAARALGDALPGRSPSD